MAVFARPTCPRRRSSPNSHLPKGQYADEVLLFRILPVPPATLRPDDRRIYVFLDSEFTSLVRPELISIGAVATDATAFYAEVRGWSPRTQFRVRAPGRDAAARWRCGGARRGGRGVHGLADERTGRAPTTIISDSGFDRWALAELLGHEDLPAGVEWKRVAVAYDELDNAVRGLQLRRHHALDDARALRHLLLNPGGDTALD